MSVVRERKELSFPVSWGTIEAIAWGNPNDKRVLVVHGTSDHAESFTRLIQLLPGNFYFIAIDLPGHGKSSHFPQGMNLESLNYVLAVHYVLDQLKWDKCFYLGHSFGACIGIIFSVMHPDRLERIVAVDILMPKIIPNHDLLKRMIQVNESTMFTMNKKDSTLYTKEQIFNALRERRIFPYNQEAADIIFQRATTKIGDLYKFNRDSRLGLFVFPLFNKEQILELVSHINIPILLIVAENSWFDVVNERDVLKVYQQKLSNLLTTVEVEGNHDVHNNNPERIASHVLAFFNDVKSKL